MNENNRNVLTWSIVAIVAFSILVGNDSSSSSNSQSSIQSTNSYYGSSGVSESRTISRDEAISEYWDEIKDYVNGTETIEACSSTSGNCYDLDAEISSGTIEQIYFTSGGYLYFSADIDENGNASDSDQNGDYWDFTLDMDSSIVNDAIDDWASSSGYIVE